MESMAVSGFRGDETILEANLAVLKRRFPDLYRLVLQHAPVVDGEVTTCANGLANLRYVLKNGANFLAYDANDPWQSAAVHLNTVPEGATGVAVFVGMGLGYGPLLVRRERPDLVKMVIVEPSLDMFCLALRYVDLTELLNSSKLHLYIKDVDYKRMELELGREVSISDTYVLKHQPSFTWNQGLYEEVNQQVYQLLNKINAMGGTTKAYGRMFVQNRFVNLSNIRCVTNTDVLKGLLKGVPALLVAAGPSLDMSIPDIKNAKGRCVIFAVDSALPTLLKNGITPDFIASLDMENANFEKVAPFLEKESQANLVITIKACPLIPKRFSAKHIFYAFNEDIPHMWIIKALGIRRLLPPLLSVAHLSVGLAQLMEASPIVLVGQDLAYTKTTGSDHASGVIFHEKGLPRDREIFYVRSIDSGDVPTDRGLLSLKQQFEEIVAASPVPIINASAMGVHIEGTEVMPLGEVIRRFMTQSVNVNELLEQAIAQHKPWQNSQISRYCSRMLSMSRSVTEKVERCRKLLKKGLSQVNNLLEKRVQAHNLSDLPARLQEEMAQLDRLNNQTDEYDELWNQVLELTYDMLKENDERRVRNERVREEQGYLAWLKAELERLLTVQDKRREVLNEYAELLQGLVHRLEEEDRLLKLLEKTGDVQAQLQAKTDLASLYVNSDDLQLAHNVLNEVLQAQPDSARGHLLMGYVQAGLLQFEEADAHFEEALKLNSGLEDEVAQMRERSAAPWLQLTTHREYVAQPDGEYLLWGEKYPHLLKTWLERIVKLQARDAIKQLFETIWPVYAGRIEQLLYNEELEKAKAMLNAWKESGVTACESVHLISYAFLFLMAAYKEENLNEVKEFLANAMEEVEGDARRMAFLARVLLENGAMEDGIALLAKATALDPETAGLWDELGDALVESQDYEGAIAAYERCLLALPQRKELLKKLGDCYLELGQVEAARAAYEALKEHMQKTAGMNSAEEAFQAGLRHQKEGRVSEAVKCYEELLQVQPNNITAWLNLGVAYSGLRRYQEAENAFRSGLKYDEENVDLLYNLACLYLDTEHVNEAELLFKRVIELKSDYAAAYNNLGHILKEYRKDYEAAIHSFEQALKYFQKGGFDEAMALYNMGNCYQELMNISKAIELYKNALQIVPDLVEAHWNLSHVLLLDGQVKEGFHEYLWRWRRKEAIPQDPVPVLRWQGEEGPGRILVWTEQGAGDNIQFVRYLPMLKEQGKKVTLACTQDLAWLFQGMQAIDNLILKSHMPHVCEGMQWHTPLLNLPTLLQKENEPFPLADGYLPVNDRLFEKFEGLFAAFQDKLKIGFVWRGNPKHNRDRERSVDFAMFEPLFAISDTAWFSLQYQSEPLSCDAPNLKNLAPYLFDFAHTAALISHLDLVITVDTSIAHLAGAVLPSNGRKRPQVWTLLAYVPDWRWGVRTDTTPWYDNMRLFRQERRGDWQAVFERVSGMIRRL